MSTPEPPLRPRPWLQWVVNAGLLLVMAATALPIAGVEGDAYKYIYAAGALMVVAGRLFMPYRGDNLRVKRLCRIEVWAGIMFCAGAFFIFYRQYGVGPTDWIAFTLAGAALQIYTSIMIPRAASK